MKDLSLFLLDIAKNSTAAGSSVTCISLVLCDNTLSLKIEDNGCGMSSELLARVTDPFTTTRTTRRVGMGIPLLKMTAEQTGGSLSIQSQPGKGTVLTAVFIPQSIDMPPLGDLASSICALIQGSPDLDFYYYRQTPLGHFELDTRQLRQVLGNVPLDTPQVCSWIYDYLTEHEAGLQQT